jgi:hypothetical protein
VHADGRPVRELPDGVLQVHGEIGHGFLQVSLGKLNNVREVLDICRTARTILGANGTRRIRSGNDDLRLV